MKAQAKSEKGNDAKKGDVCLKTPAEYRDKLVAMRKNVVKDKLVEDISADVDLDKGINVVSVSYEYAHDETKKDFMQAKSPLTGKTIHRYNHIPQTKEDLKKRFTMINTLAKETICAQRCVGSDALYALYLGTYLVDNESGLNTNYHQKFLKFLKYIQDSDIAPAGAITDAKGDRSLSPAEQTEKDSYVHIISKDDKGIRVSGIKSPITMGAYAEEICVLPGRPYSSRETDYAIAFAISGDADGITRYVLSPDVHATEGEFSPCRGNKYLQKEAMIVFEDVFVPWDRVFLCGEYKYAGLFAEYFATVHRFSYCCCKPAVFDIIAGAAALISEFNGTEGKYLFGDSKEKLFELMKSSDTIYAMGQIAIDLAKETGSKAILPDAKYANLGKYISGEQFPKAIALLQNMAGNLPVSLPYEKAFKDKKFGKQLRKAFSRKEGVSPEDHYRLNDFIRTIAASDEGGLMQFGAQHGGGTVEVEKAAIYSQNIKKIKSNKTLAKKQARIS